MSLPFAGDKRSTVFTAAAALALFIIPLFISPSGTAPAGAEAGLSPAGNPAIPMMREADLFAPELPGKGKFLVAGRALADPGFRETVVLLISYGAGGATGLIINLPTNVRLADMLSPMPGLKDRGDIVYYGGPVEGRRMLMLIRSNEKPEESAPVFGNVYVSASRNALGRMIVAHRTERDFRVYAGYAGWLPGQLEGEVKRGDWHIIPADARSIFDKKSTEIWRELIRRSSAIQVWNRTWLPGIVMQKNDPPLEPCCAIDRTAWR